MSAGKGNLIILGPTRLDTKKSLTEEVAVEIKFVFYYPILTMY